MRLFTEIKTTFSEIKTMFSEIQTTFLTFFPPKKIVFILLELVFKRKKR
jgi:hypothetical protein